MGSPLPENVITSRFSPADRIAESFSSSFDATSSRVGNPVVPVPWALKPASQYRQSNEHTLPSSGNRFMPNDVPSLLLWIGPNTVSEKSTRCISAENDVDYCNFASAVAMRRMDSRMLSSDVA